MSFRNGNAIIMQGGEMQIESNDFNLKSKYYN